MLSVLIVRLVGALMQATILLLLARAVNAPGFGIYVLLTSLFGLLAVVLGFGTSSLALRVQSLADPTRSAKGILTTRSMILVPVILLTTVALLMWSTLDPWIVGAAAAATVLETTSQQQESLLFGQGRHRAAQVLMFVRRALVFSAVIVTSLLDHEVIVTYTIANIVAVLALYGRARSANFSLGSVLPTLREARGYWFPTVLARLETLDIAVASPGLSGLQLGSFAAASRLASPLQMLPSSLLSIFTPHLAGISNTDRRKTETSRAIKALFLTLIPVTLLSPLAGRVGEILLGPSYSGTTWLLPAFVTGVMFNGISQALISYFYSSDRPDNVRNARIIGLPVGLCCIWILATLGGPLAAAWGTAGMHGIVSCLLIRSFGRD